MSNTEIFRYDYLDESKDKGEFYTFQNRLEYTPQLLSFSPDQNKCIVASNSEAIYVDINNFQEIDLDEMEELESIQNCTCDGKYFYLMANKKERKLGYYILRLDLDKPGDIDYLVQWNN
jgi:hypothetical protein